jgi:hypothetical protein
MEINPYVLDVLVSGILDLALGPVRKVTKIQILYLIFNNIHDYRSYTGGRGSLRLPFPKKVL